jgi:hypothetical protein
MGGIFQGMVQPPLTLGVSGSGGMGDITYQGSKPWRRVMDSDVWSVQSMGT